MCSEKRAYDLSMPKVEDINKWVKRKRDEKKSWGKKKMTWEKMIFKKNKWMKVWVFSLLWELPLVLGQRTEFDLIKATCGDQIYDLSLTISIIYWMWHQYPFLKTKLIQFLNLNSSRRSVPFPCLYHNITYNTLLEMTSPTIPGGGVQHTASQSFGRNTSSIQSR